MARFLKLSVYFLARLSGIFLLFRWLSRDRLRILCYHGGCIGDEDQYNPLLFCPPELFASRVHWLRKRGFTFLSLDAASSLLSSSAARPRLPVVITFDDGWHSTGATLLPILQRFHIPSTLYLCTQHYLEAWPVPAVSVRYIIWKSRRRDMLLAGFGEQVDGYYDLRDQRQRQQLAEKMVGWISATHVSREQVIRSLEKFAACLGVASSALELASRRFSYMSKAELLAASAAGCSIELHGHVHAYALDDPAALERDLRLCKQFILDAGLPNPRHYCYPSGRFDRHAPGVLTRMGVQSGTTCFPGLISRASPTERYFLPRFLDGGNITALEFEAEMSGFAEFVRRCARTAKTPLALFAYGRKSRTA